MKRISQSVLGGLVIMAWIIAWIAVATFAGAPEWVIGALIGLLAGPLITFTYFFPGGPDELFFSASAFWATVVFDVISYSLVAYLIIGWFTVASDMRKTVHRLLGWADNYR